MPIFADLAPLRRDPLTLLEDRLLAADAPPVIRLSVPGRVFATAEPALFRSVLTDAVWAKGREQERLVPFLGRGLVTASGPRWEAEHKILAPAFRGASYDEALEPLADRVLPSVAWIAGRVADRAVPAPFGRELGLGPLAVAAALRLVLTGLFRADLTDAELDHASDVVGRASAAGADRITALVALPAWLPTPANRRAKALRRELDALAETILARMAPGGGLARALATLGQRHGPLAERDQVITLLIAGFETSSSAAAFGLYELASRPDLVATFRQITDRFDGTASALSRLPFVQACVKETLRLYPSAWWYTRMAAQHGALHGHRIKPGDTLVLCPWAMHRRPDLWDEPDVFDPYRWLAADDAGLRGRAWKPFGDGPRVCIGQHLASVQIALIFWAVTAGFDLSRAAGAVAVPRPRAAITLGMPEAGLPVRMAVRPVQEPVPAAAPAAAAG